MSMNATISELVLERGDSGLGFNIRGGIDIPHVPGDPGIFVTRLKEDGAAFKDGRLKEGDKILEVNGKNIERVTHNEAVQIFITAGNTVRMKVHHGAYAQILKNMESRPPAAHGEPAPSAAGSSSKAPLIGILVLVAAIGVGAFLFKRFQPIEG